MSERLARTLFALSDTNRLNIVELLKTGPLPVGEIAAQLGLNQPQTSKHLKVLLEAGYRSHRTGRQPPDLSFANRAVPRSHCVEPIV